LVEDNVPGLHFEAVNHADERADEEAVTKLFGHDKHGRSGGDEPHLKSRDLNNFI
jgi:hypothetical protein